MKFCPNCGEQLPDGQTFCTRCGTAMPVQQAGGGYFGPTIRQSGQFPPDQATRAQGAYPQGNAFTPGNGQGGAGAYPQGSGGFPQGGMYPPGNAPGGSYPPPPYPPGNNKRKGRNPLPIVLIVILMLAICGTGGYFAARTFLFPGEDTGGNEEPAESRDTGSGGGDGENAQSRSEEDDARERPAETESGTGAGNGEAGGGGANGTDGQEERGNADNADEEKEGGSMPGNPGGAENAPGHENAPGADGADPSAEPESQPRPVTTEVFYANRLDFSHLRPVPIFRERVFESSRIVQSDRTIDNSGYMAFDGNDQTSWQEGRGGDGIGEYVEAGFDREYRVKALTLLLGNHRNSRDWFLLNNRPRQIAVTLGPAIFHAEFPDERAQFALEFSAPVPASSIRITIESVYPGRQYSDTCIADITVYESIE